MKLQPVAGHEDPAIEIAFITILKIITGIKFLLRRQYTLSA